MWKKGAGLELAVSVKICVFLNKRTQKGIYGAHIHIYPSNVHLKSLTLIGLLSWMEHCPVHQKAAGLIPSRGTYGR